MKIKNKIYGFPVLPKPGLGNKLIPWADCFIWCKDFGFEQVAPFWHKLRIGSYIRGERDKRLYQKLFINKNLIAGIIRLGLLLISYKISAEEFRMSKNNKTSAASTLVFFRP